MNYKEEILKGREERAKLITSYLKDYSIVISVKANMPGEDKNNYLSYLLINAFSFLIAEIKNDGYVYDYNSDGPYLILLLKAGNSDKIKEQMINIEEKHDLGRLIDIDVYSNGISLSRKNKRECIICGNTVTICMRNKKHNYQELISYIKAQVINFYRAKLEGLIDNSIMTELNLHPKFGLVTPKSSGSHKDMNFNLMIRAKNAIIPYFLDMFTTSCEITNSKVEIHKLVDLGIQAEKAMLLATNNINAYKGLIFNLGLIISAYGYKLSRFELNSVFDVSKYFTFLLYGSYEYNGNSYGDQAYRKYNVTGARGEALSGFINVQKGIKILQDLSWDNLMKTLIFYISSIEDTSFLKRAGTFTKYQEIKEKFKRLNITDSFELKKLNDLCIENNLSFGGSADLLALSVFIWQISQYLVELKEKKC